MKINNLFTVLLLTCVFQVVNGVNLTQNDDHSSDSNPSTTAESINIADAQYNNSLHHTKNANVLLQGNKPTTNKQSFSLHNINVFTLDLPKIVNDIIGHIKIEIEEFKNDSNVNAVFNAELNSLEEKMISLLIQVSGDLQENNKFIALFDRPFYPIIPREKRISAYRNNNVAKVSSKVSFAIENNQQLKHHATNFEAFIDQYNKDLVVVFASAESLEYFNGNNMACSIFFTIVISCVIMVIGLFVYNTVFGCILVEYENKENFYKMLEALEENEIVQNSGNAFKE